MTLDLKYLKFSDADFRQQLDAHLAVNAELDDELTQTVANILKDVRLRGDDALLKYTNRFDQRHASIDELETPPAAFQAALSETPGFDN